MTKPKTITRWEEKYRPITLKHYVGNENFKKNAQKWIDENDPPNLLLEGTPGTGKTTTSCRITRGIETY